MAASDEWVPATAFHLARVNERLVILRLGQKFRLARTPVDEVVLEVVAEVPNYDEGVVVLRSLRAALIREQESGQ